MENLHENHGCAKHAGGDAGHCCGQHRPMQRFMEASLLMLLARKDAHGYYLTEQLERFGLGSINLSTLYRIMRRMEEHGWVSSRWQKGGQGPKKRVYSITQAGLDALCEWIEVFRQRRQNIDLLLGEYDRFIAEEK